MRRRFHQAVAGQPRPKHLSIDDDPLFCFHRWRANLRVLEIHEIKFGMVTVGIDAIGILSNPVE